VQLLKYLYLNSRFFLFTGLFILIFIFGHFFPFLVIFGKTGLLAVAFLSLIDLLLLFYAGDGISAERKTPEKLSNGDENSIYIRIRNRYRFPVTLKIIDELPVQFQIRDFQRKLRIPPFKEKELTYSLRPVMRGEYHFGALNIFAATPLGLASRRYKFGQDVMIPVYPSYLQMRKFELFSWSDRLWEAGVRRIRRVGHTMEFDQIRQYIEGDDYRSINWKATARVAKLMVNQYQDEKSQQVYNAIDMGRVMKMPFDGMSLLDYAINASLVLSNIAIRRQDKAGVITFSNGINSVLAADAKYSQMFRILELLYNQTTTFAESGFEALYAFLCHRLSQRSLILLYTNFETLSALKRQLPYLARISRNHLLVTIFFENTELAILLQKSASRIEDIYIKTIAEKFAFEKKQIVKELNRHGIICLLTTPQNLTVAALNKYLELKARAMI
jgi:uncharacterized protein (DUF58 family)